MLLLRAYELLRKSRIVYDFRKMTKTYYTAFKRDWNRRVPNFMKLPSKNIKRSFPTKQSLLDWWSTLSFPTDVVLTTNKQEIPDDFTNLSEPGFLSGKARFELTA